MSTNLIPAADVSLDSSPSEYMAVVLNRAKGWLAEAQSIDEVRETKAIAVGYESVIREKELAFDAQLAATEIVRRCERRIGQLVREGQERGEIRTRGDDTRTDLVRDKDEVKSARGFFQHSDEMSHSYAMAGAPDEQFESALDEAKAEGNLSRANVVRKVKGEQPKTPERSEWHRNRRHIDSNRILDSLATELDAATAGLELMQPEDLDPEVLDHAIPLIKQSIATINRHVRRIQHG
jgi:hypothetical protein